MARQTSSQGGNIPTLLGGFRYLSYVQPTGRVWHKAFLCGSRRRAVAQTRPAFLKMPLAPSAFPWKGSPQAPVINLAPPRRVRTWGDGPRRLDDAGQSELRPIATGTRTHPTRSVHRKNAADRSVSLPNAS